MFRARLLAVASLALFFATGANADPHPKGFQEHKFNGPTRPVTKDGVTTFQIFDGGCSKVDYGDGRGESDCNKGNIRSILRYSPDTKLGQSVEYRFDIQIDPTFAYPGRFHGEVVKYDKSGWDSHLRIASWEGPFLHNFLYMLKVDAKQGITFLTEQCQPPDKFGNWVTFSMKVRWAADAKGWIETSCDDKVIYREENVATNQAPQCWEFTNQCLEGVVRQPKKFNFLLGPVMLGNGCDCANQFTPIQPEGITVRMRNIAVTTKGVKLKS